jgi:peptidoglycan/xylan/chitin deacetylase (PgdA/CDA1 family)
MSANHIRSKVIKISGSLLLRYPRIFKNLLEFRSNSLRIVYYHMVSDRNHAYYFNDKSISVDQFVKQIGILKKFFDVISLNEALMMLKSGQPLFNKLVITFDDGFRECSTVVAPILLEESVTATFFLIGNCLNNNDLMWRNKLLILQNNSISRGVIDNISCAFNLERIKKNESIMNWSKLWPMHLKECISNALWSESGAYPLKSFLDDYKPYMSDKQVKELVSNGFEIGSHSMTHPFFSKLNYEQFYMEILDSITLLEDRYNTNVQTFSYPFGDRSNNLEFESRFINEFDGVKLFLGTRNSLNNYQKYSFWSRDNLEFNNNEAIFRLSILPIARYLQSKIS